MARKLLLALLLFTACSHQKPDIPVMFGPAGQTIGSDPTCNCFLASSPHAGYCEDRCSPDQCSVCLQGASL